MNIVLFGPPGSGKGTQARRLEKELGWAHVASGDLFRDHFKRRSDLGRMAKRYMDKGRLVPDEVTIGMLKERLLRPDVSAGVLLDGFPRTMAQAEALDRLLAGLRRKVDAVLHIRVSDEELVRRLSGRLICRECQISFHKLSKPFRSCPTDRCQGEFLYQRKDDDPATVRKRLKTYEEQTEPLLDYYDRRGVLVEVAGEGTVEEVFQACLGALEKLDRKARVGDQTAC